MRTFGEFITEAEGFQGKMTPEHSAKNGAITIQNKLGEKKPNPPGKLAHRPVTRAVQVPGKLAVRQNRNTTTTKEPIGAPRQQKTSPSSKTKAPSSGKPFRKDVRASQADNNSPKKGSEAVKVSDDLASQQRKRMFQAKPTSNKGKNSKSLLRRGVETLGRAALDTQKDKRVGTGSEGSLSGPTISQGGRTSK